MSFSMKDLEERTIAAMESLKAVKDGWGKQPLDATKIDAVNAIDRLIALVDMQSAAIKSLVAAHNVLSEQVAAVKK